MMESDNVTLVEESDLACDQHMGFVVNSLAAGFVCLLGFAGNSMAFMVLTRDKETPIASFLLQSLAFADNIFLSFWFLHFSLYGLFVHLGIMNSFHVTWWYIRVYTYPMTFVAQTGTIYMTVLIAATRYFAVCKPYLAVKLGNLRNIKIGVYSVFIFSLVYNLPRFFETQIVFIATNGTAKYNILRTWMGTNRFYQLIYFDIMYYLFSFLVPLLLLAILNTKLTIAYRAVRLRRRESFQMRIDRENNDHNITLVMIIVVLVFMLCNAPARVAQIIWAYNLAKCHSLGFWIMKISNVLEVFNSSINFVIYCVFRRQFRQVLKPLFCRRRHESESTPNQYQLQPLTGPLRTMDSSAYVNGHIMNCGDK